MVNTIDVLPADEFDVMTALFYFMQTEKFARVFDAMIKRGRCFARSRLLVSFSLPLPALFAIECLGKNMLFIRLNIDPHLPGTHRAISPVHFEARIDDVQMNLNRFDGLDRSPAAHGVGITLDHFIEN